jgi:choloylglycine hydrolase
MRQLLQAPYLPFDGLNERGLAVTMMAVPSSEGGRDPKKVTIDSLAVIRLMLDYADGVDKAVELLAGYNVDFGGGPPVHYLIADASGNSEVIEFLNDKMRVMRGDGSFQVSTNFLLFPEPPRNGRSGCWRFNRIFETLSRAEGHFTPEKGMDLLQSVSQTGEHPTIWSCLYDLSARDVWVVMGRNFGRVHRLSLSSQAWGE